MRLVLPLAFVVLVGCATLAKLDDRIDFSTFGADFDDVCIAGKMRRESAAWMNANQETWKVHGDYTDARQPNPIKKGDRIFNGHCSEVTKRLGDGDIEGAFEALAAVADGGAR